MGQKTGYPSQIPLMNILRRHFLALAAAPLLDGQTLPEPIRRLKPMTAGIVPITDDERRARIEKARVLMRKNNLSAIFLEGGSSLYYFTGTRWGGSERTFGVVIPAGRQTARS